MKKHENIQLNLFQHEIDQNKQEEFDLLAWTITESYRIYKGGQPGHTLPVPNHLKKYFKNNSQFLKGGNKWDGEQQQQ